MNDNDYYYISAKLKEPVLNYIVGKVLIALNEPERAKVFIDQAIEYIK